ncbi:MAG: adenylosuccinate synthase [Polyangiaceae bacterium]|nr:adenylosuccinate synthase [Polyangiaceae bacterium]MCW5791617.1 adenylosuccinate synthase [Polyangiaceae bacterium]
MSSVVIVGAQWGDEGKGKIVDIYTEFAELVVRYAGGPNAGHTLVIGDEKLVVRLVPSGILRPNTRCVLGQGMVVDVDVLLGEIDELTRRGHTSVTERLVVSDRAHLIMPYHILVDTLREAGARADQAIGTTKKGIGPAYEDKARRLGLHLGLLRSPDVLREKVALALEAWRPIIEALGGEQPSLEEALAPALSARDRLVPLLGDASHITHEALTRGVRVMFEGAQGTLLDVDHGTYPFVTSSSAVAGGAATGAGIGPSRIGKVVGITKAYTTRVGAGPFPTELEGASGDHLRHVGAEFGSVTGRPRRTGWLDLPALRYAARVNGLDALAITKLDVLTGLPELKVCVAYDTPDGRVADLPIDRLTGPGAATPVLEALPTWTEDLSQARSLAELPEAARGYLKRLEQAVEVPLCLVSVGPGRHQTITLQDPFDAR